MRLPIGSLFARRYLFGPSYVPLSRVAASRAGLDLGCFIHQIPESMGGYFCSCLMELASVSWQLVRVVIRNDSATLPFLL